MLSMSLEHSTVQAAKTVFGPETRDTRIGDDNEHIPCQNALTNRNDTSVLAQDDSECMHRESSTVSNLGSLQISDTHSTNPPHSSLILQHQPLQGVAEEQSLAGGFDEDLGLDSESCLVVLEYMRLTAPRILDLAIQELHSRNAETEGWMDSIDVCAHTVSHYILTF
jgi:hypothetical protein